MAETRTFPIGAILTGTTGKMLCEDGFGQFHEMVEFMCNGPVWTHELPSLADMIKADLLRQYPGLPTEADVDETTWRAFVEEQKAAHGVALEVEPIPDYGRTKGPLTTAVETMSTDPTHD